MSLAWFTFSLAVILPFLRDLDPMRFQSCVGPSCHEPHVDAARHQGLAFFGAIFAAPILFPLIFLLVSRRGGRKDFKTLNAALAGGAQSGRPWEFRAQVSKELSQADRAVFDAIWEEAVAPRHWTTKDLGQCTTRAAAALRGRFPDLSPEAVSAVVSAAAYDWR